MDWEDRRNRREKMEDVAIKLERQHRCRVDPGKRYMAALMEGLYDDDGESPSFDEFLHGRYLEMPVEEVDKHGIYKVARASSEMVGNVSGVTGDEEKDKGKEQAETGDKRDSAEPQVEEEEGSSHVIRENGNNSNDESRETMTAEEGSAEMSNCEVNHVGDEGGEGKENGDQDERCDKDSEVEMDTSDDVVAVVGVVMEESGDGNGELSSSKDQQGDAPDKSGKTCENEPQLRKDDEHCSDSNLASSDKENQSLECVEVDMEKHSETASELAETNDASEKSTELSEKASETAPEITLDEEKMETDKNEEEKSNKPETGEEEEKTKDGESDSDDDRPQIFLRNFAEITERDSDDDEDVQEIFISDQGTNPAMVTDTETSTKLVKTYSKKDSAASRLLEIATYDEKLSNLDMAAENSANRHKPTDRKLSRACTKLTMWLKRQVSTPSKPDSRSEAAAIQPLSVVRPSAPDNSRQTRLVGNSSRDSSASVLNSMLQSVQQTYQPAPMSASQLVYGRGTPVSTRPRQPVPPLSLISTSNSFPTGTLIAQSVPGIWQPPGPQIVQRPSAPGMQMRNSTQVTSVTSVPRPSTVGSNIQQPFTQLIYDPSTGYLICPTSQSCQLIPQQANTIQQQRTVSPSNTIRLQNGMIIRANDQSYNNVRQAIGNRNGLEISLTSGPQLNSQQQRMPLLPPAQVRPFNTVQHPRQQVSSRLMRPQAPAMQQNLMASQQVQRNRNPGQIPPRGPPPRFAPIRSAAPQPQRPQSILRPSSAPRVNGIPVAVPLPGKPSGQGTSAASADTSNVTAGNQKPIPGTVDESDSDLQNKTFPSLVVIVKTCLTTKPTRQLQTKSRSELDAGVKAVLIHTPAKFTEWLMKRGLLKLAHFCDLHPSQSFKLGMYSDSSRQPFSGGYVWTSDCCPDRQISVFSGSIFEGSKYPPGTVLKLMYHWACQTPANNILQWVKVSSLYLKNFFTLLRAVCISWMHEQCPPMGGESKYVEIGVITLGSSAETSRGVKNVNVEILGVFDPATKIIRMKVINSMQGQLFKDKNKGGKPDAYEQGARAFQILWPLTHWVDKRSILLVDGIIDRALFQELGFKNIQQCNDGQRNVASNMNVMNYLRNLVPKMFSSTLSVLSKSIVQQFLDELSWREMYGSTVLSCFENLQDHIGSMTKWDLRGESLITRLNKINQNPFVDWSYTKQTRRCPLNTVPLSLRNEPGIRECVKHVMKDEKKQPPPPPVYTPNQTPALAPTASSYAAPQPKAAQKRKIIDTALANTAYYKETYDTAPKIHSLQAYYYGSVRADENPSLQPIRFPPNLKCPMCTRTFTTNVEVCRHIYTHISSVTYRGSENSVCRICLKELPMGVSMPQHMHIAHIMVGFNTACRICEEKFKTEQELVIHMWDLHQRRETPYKCGSCNYASSFHYYAVQHHQEKHCLEADAMCPFCLKIFSCATLAQLKLLINHLQAHAQLQRRLKKCPRCVLTFVSDTDLEIHLQEHRSQEPSAKWIPYLLPPNETNVKMAAPPPSKTPLQISMMAASAAAMASAVPPAKKQKVSTYPAKKKQSTLNATLAVPIDTNEKFGGSKYKIVIPSTAKGLCAECNEDINKPNHYIGKLICSKCRFNTACQAAMDLHHEKNHKPGSNERKPGIKTKAVALLKEPMLCKCGFSSINPNKLANHLIICDKMTAYPKQRTPVSVPVSEADVPPKSPTQPGPSSSAPVTAPLHAPLSPTLGLLGNEPVTTFDDMLSLEESMASTLEALALPPLLSPSAPMPQSPLSVFESAAGPANSSNGITNSQANASGNADASNSTWDPDAWELPLSGLIAKCKQNNA